MIWSLSKSLSSLLYMSKVLFQCHWHIALVSFKMPISSNGFFFQALFHIMYACRALLLVEFSLL